MDAKKVEGGGGMNWEFDIYPLICIKYITDMNKLYSTGNYLMLGGNLNGKEILKRGDICVHIADSLCCTAETNTTL